MLNGEVYTTNFHAGSERETSHSLLLGLLHELHVKLVLWHSLFLVQCTRFLKVIILILWPLEVMKIHTETTSELDGFLWRLGRRAQ